jgi:N-acetylmuramoyl-L-alanine amidase
MPRTIDKIFLHCSASSLTGQRAALIRSWHKERGWNDIGYHFFIGFDGLLESGRALDVVGAHVEGHNSTSIGICLAGGHVRDFRPSQFDSLKLLLGLLKKAYPKATLHGHNEFNKGKECPVFDMKPWKEMWEKL